MQGEGREFSDELIASAELCLEQAGCVTNPERVCKALYPISEQYMFVHGAEKEDCPYRVPFGARSTICRCPVRNAMFRTLGI